jgi:DNA-directed RNA polymerase subunit RPC12/RpoP
MTIPLHPEKGINAMLGWCPRCGRQNSEIVLAGRSFVYTCRKCGHRQAGYKRHPCQCGNNESYDFDSRPIEESDRIMGGLCDECAAEVKEHEAIVAAGGVYFKCKCGMRGVVKAESPIAAIVRENLNLPAPEPCGLEVEACHVCKPEDFVEESNSDQGRAS